MAFPTLFPLEKADYKLPHPRRLALYEWAKHLIHYKDLYFTTHPHFHFFALNLIFCHHAMQQGKFLFLRDIADHPMTVGQLKTALARDTGPQLASKIVHCVRTVHGTRPYWFMEAAKLKDMIEQIGTPTLFYTLSMADLSWPDLHCLMPDDPFRKGLSNEQSYQIQAQNISPIPTLCLPICQQNTMPLGTPFCTISPIPITMTLKSLTSGIVLNGKLADQVHLHISYIPSVFPYRNPF